eukprot:859352-Amphidinium_carterae.1
MSLALSFLAPDQLQGNEGIPFSTLPDTLDHPPSSKRSVVQSEQIQLQRGLVAQGITEFATFNIPCHKRMAVSTKLRTLAPCPGLPGDAQGGSHDCKG